MSQSHIPGTFEPVDSATTRTRRMSGPTEVNRPQHHLHTDSQQLPRPSQADQEYLQSDDHVPGAQDRARQTFGKGEATGQVPTTPWNSEATSGLESDISDFSGFKSSGTHASSFAGIPSDRSTTGQTAQFRTPTDQFVPTSRTQVSHPKFGSQLKSDDSAKSPFADVHAEEGGRVASSQKSHPGQKYNLTKEDVGPDAVSGGARERSGDQDPVHFQHSLAGQPGSTAVPGGVGYQSATLPRDDKKSSPDRDQSKTTETMRHGPSSGVKQAEKDSIGTGPGSRGGTSTFGYRTSGKTWI